MIWHWFLHVIGVLPRTPSTAYNAWSGFISDLGEVAIVGAIFRHLNCHVTHCPRFGLHPVGDGRVKVCRKHHPGLEKRITVEHVQQIHNASQPRPKKATSGS